MLLRYALPAALAIVALLLVWLFSRVLPDPVGEAVVEGCEARVAQAHGGAAVEILESRDLRSPAPDPEGVEPTGPAGDTLHTVSVDYVLRGADGTAEDRAALCLYEERAAQGGFDPARLRFEDGFGSGGGAS